MVKHQRPSLGGTLRSFLDLAFFFLPFDVLFFLCCAVAALCCLSYVFFFKCLLQPFESPFRCLTTAVALQHRTCTTSRPSWRSCVAPISRLSLPAVRWPQTTAQPLARARPLHLVGMVSKCERERGQVLNLQFQVIGVCFLALYFVLYPGADEYYTGCPGTFSAGPPKCPEPSSSDTNATHSHTHTQHTQHTAHNTRR